jgi:hypothetical protein
VCDADGWEEVGAEVGVGVGLGDVGRQHVVGGDVVGGDWRCETRRWRVASLVEDVVPPSEGMQVG